MRSSVWFIPEGRMCAWTLLSSEIVPIATKVWEKTSWTGSGAVTAFWGKAFSVPVQCHGISRLGFSCHGLSGKQWCCGFTAAWSMQVSISRDTWLCFKPLSHLSKDAESWTCFGERMYLSWKAIRYLFVISTSAWLTCLCNIPAEDPDQAYYRTQTDKPVW